MIDTELVLFKMVEVLLAFLGKDLVIFQSFLTYFPICLVIYLVMLLPEIEVSLGLERDKMDVGVGHFHAQDGDPDPLAGNRRLERDGDLAGESPEAGVGLLVQVEDVIVLHLLGNHEGMPLGKGVDVEEGIEVFALGDLPGRDFAGGDAGEDRGHGATRLKCRES